MIPGPPKAIGETQNQRRTASRREQRDRRRVEAERERVGSRGLARLLGPALWPVRTRRLRDIPNFGAVAQPGERRFCKPEVVGSIPISSIMLDDGLCPLRFRRNPSGDRGVDPERGAWRSREAIFDNLDG